MARHSVGFRERFSAWGASRTRRSWRVHPNQVASRVTQRAGYASQLLSIAPTAVFSIHIRRGIWPELGFTEWATAPVEFAPRQAP
ncbi:hypothetical protein D3C71_887410 [compost metagenome]